MHSIYLTKKANRNWLLYKIRHHYVLLYDIMIKNQNKARLTPIKLGISICIMTKTKKGRKVLTSRPLY